MGSFESSHPIPDRSKKLEILLNTFQEKLEASDAKASDLNAQLNELRNSNAALQETIALRDTVTSHPFPS